MTVFSPSAADLTSLEPDQQSSMTPVCDYATYMRMLSENADLQRTNGLLKLESGKSGLGEAEKVEALQTEVKILSGNNKGRSGVDILCLRVLPYIISMKFWGFLTLSPRPVRKTYVRFVCRFGIFFYPLSPFPRSVRTSYVEAPPSFVPISEESTNTICLRLRGSCD